MKTKALILAGAILIVPVLIAAVAREQTKETYTVAFIGVPFSNDSIVMEFLPESISLRRATNIKSNWISYTSIPASHSFTPTFRNSLNPTYSRSLECDWVFTTAVVSIVSLLLFVSCIAISENISVPAELTDG